MLLVKTRQLVVFANAKILILKLITTKVEFGKLNLSCVC